MTTGIALQITTAFVQFWLPFVVLLACVQWVKTSIFD